MFLVVCIFILIGPFIALDESFNLLTTHYVTDLSSTQQLFIFITATSSYLLYESYQKQLWIDGAIGWVAPGVALFAMTIA